MAIVSMTLEEAKRIMTPEKIRMEFEEAEKYPINYDDIPPCTREELVEMRQNRERRLAHVRRKSA